MLTRDRTTRRIKRKTLVHYLVSPPHRPATGSATSQSYTYRATGATPLRDSVNTDCLTRLEVAPQGHAPCAFLMSRARRFIPMSRARRFIPRSGVKSKIKMCLFARLSGNFARRVFP
ncbi:TPA: hypothetical protein NO668_004772 [Klebsiella pneumoniae]|nr:hypothetical protein [Klebsiella pneumoniae]HCI5310088.1 hypothetical protein [Klebsiella pneumoniae]HCI5466529.1 hypothetical protein [Klebsiella pneumoniae]HCI5801725.1 hypothetical protein [Klebsiella pneumoniae]